MKNFTIVIDSVDPLEPTQNELRGAKFLVEQIEQCGDNIDKKIRLVAMIMHNINQTIECHKAITLTAYGNERRMRVRKNLSKTLDYLAKR